MAIMNNIASTWIDDRQGARSDVSIAAGLRTAQGRRVPALLKNISRHGFMAECGAALTPGLLVTLDLFDRPPIEARIVWKREGHIGAAFIYPIDEATLAAIA